MPGSRSDVPVQSEDYYPTLLEGLGLSPAMGQQFDGSSFLPALRGEVPERAPLFQYFPHSTGVPDWLPPAVSVHRGDWKLIRIFHGGDDGAHRLLLFDLANDPGEQHNLAVEQAQVAAELDGLIELFLQRTKAVVPIPNPAFDPQQYDPSLEGKSQPKRQKAASQQTAAAGLSEDAAI
ncbi:MAG: N-acetylgalactosamine-6-sulfatase, partial [Planctomyces sp.]